MSTPNMYTRQVYKVHFVPIDPKSNLEEIDVFVVDYSMGEAAANATNNCNIPKTLQVKYVMIEDFKLSYVAPD